MSSKQNYNIVRTDKIADKRYRIQVFRNDSNKSKLHSYWNYNYVFHLRFQVLTAERIEMAVFEVVAPCNLAEFYWRFSDVCCLHH
jgi:hypothetical protein